MNMNDVYTAKERLQFYLEETPLIHSTHLKKRFDKEVWLKIETQLPTGSFKPRPAFNSILTHLDAARKKGVIASSSGNFAQGVAYAARELGVKAIIVMTENTSPYKIQRTKALGAEVVLCANSLEDRVKTTKELQEKTGRVLLHPYDTEETIAGDGTIGLELSEQLGKKLNNMSILVPVSGGGLIAGISFVIKTLYPKAKIIGVQPKNNGSLLKSFEAGHCVNVGTTDSIADALLAAMPGETSFTFIKNYVDEVILVEETEIQAATGFLIEEHKLVVEPGGAVCVAALATGKVTAPECVCIISGGNINLLND